ncbi:arylesterase [Chryseosolibacter indicus]|uniref:Arylesterase n=1 Tax=Chryseosolibacter indicus TaxID=2782351 RepID=A0ABS5VP50_9BACT|nr:arylesterase [Chryseosolibacter indicus]MBT1702559.1 arylesterase [Chryseosolibacter indicus]
MVKVKLFTRMVAKTLLFISILFFIQASDKPKVILFYGDSLTAGYGLSPEEAFPSLIEQQLIKSGKPTKAVNAGLSGETSAGGLTRIDWVLRQPIDIFVLELGANDGLRGLPLEQTKKNLQAIIDKVKSKYPQTKIVIAGMMVPPNMGPEYSSKFKDLFPALARQNKAVLIPFLLQDVAGNEKLNQADGIHPNPEGHRIVANNVYKVLNPLL